MSRDIIRRFPFDAAYMCCGRLRRALGRKVTFTVGGGVRGGGDQGDGVGIVEEYPENFFCYVRDFFAPVLVWPGCIGDSRFLIDVVGVLAGMEEVEVEGTAGKSGEFVSEIGEDAAGAEGALRGGGGGEMDV